MRRMHKGLGGAAAVFVGLAWIWPTGIDRVAEDAGAESTVAASPSAPDSPTPAAEPTPSPAPAGQGLAPGTYDGPLGTRNHTGDHTLALTFDDGPDPKWTPKVLAELRERDVKATFCVIGAYAEDYPDLIADIVHDGHTLCNHTWFHEFDLGQRGEAEIRANLQRTNDAIQEAAPGTEVEYFRHPAGQWTDRAIDVAAEMGMESLHWAVDPTDWYHDTTEKHIRKHVLKHSEPGSIVLLHDGGSNQKPMFKALKHILDEFDSRGYTLVAL